MTDGPSGHPLRVDSLSATPTAAVDPLLVCAGHLLCVLVSQVEQPQSDSKGDEVNHHEYMAELLLVVDDVDDHLPFFLHLRHRSGRTGRSLRV